MDKEKLHFRHVMLYEFRKEIKKKIGAVTKNIQEVYLDYAPALRTVKKWFAKFRGDFNFEDKFWASFCHWWRRSAYINKQYMYFNERGCWGPKYWSINRVSAFKEDGTHLNLKFEYLGIAFVVRKKQVGPHLCSRFFTLEEVFFWTVWWLVTVKMGTVYQSQTQTYLEGNKPADSVAKAELHSKVLLFV